MRTMSIRDASRKEGPTSMPLPNFADDGARLDWIAQKLYSGVLSDACDAAGQRDRALAPDIRPLDETKVLVGRAKTVVWASMFHVPGHPYDKEIAAVDSLRPGDVFVMAVGRSREIVPWGELLSNATLARGGRGAVLDGLVRDSRQIQALGLPVFCVGRRPYDSCGRGIVVDYDVPITLDGVGISPGDLVFGDADGVVIVPAAVEAEVLERAWTKVGAEGITREAIRAGTPLSEVFRTYGIL
jgi:4-hydroxy-4-methyl-2-oxoglutarate aldolase